MAKPWDVTSDEIAQWSMRYDAPSVLPDLVRRLLLATSPISSISMSAHAGTRLPGVDGVVRSSTSTPFCPDGTSVWELTVQEELHKLNEDFKKRKAELVGLEPRAVTYVAVSARRVPAKDRWVADRRAEGVFRDVRLLHAEDLAAWLAVAPAVSRWFASYLGHPAAQAEDLDGFLSAWSARTSPPLPIEIALAGEERVRSAESVRAWARRARPADAPQRIHAETCDEAAVFAAAALATDPTTEGQQIRSRTVVVTSQEALASALRGQQAQPLIVLAAFRDAYAGAGNVLLSMDGPLPDTGRRAGAAGLLRLSPAPFRRFADILTSAGMDREEAQRAAKASGGSLGALQRELGYVVLPEWARSFEVGALSVLLLAGAFEPNNQEDRDVLALLGLESRDAESLCERLRVAPGSPMVREEGRGSRAVWTWRSADDAWKALAGQLPADVLRRFADAVRLVLGERDPRLDLPTQQRFAAALYGKTLRASSALREGLASSLARLGHRDAALAPFHGPRRGSSLALLAVRDLLPPEWPAWASLADLLPVLAEASPKGFLDCMEESLKAGKEGAAHLLAMETGFGGNPHTGLLWALETLGWDDTLMPRVASALAKLAEHDDELEREAAREKKQTNRIANRPAASLARLLGFVLPQTRASLEQRLGEVRRRLVETHDVGFNLLISEIDGLNGGKLLSPARRPEVWPLLLLLPSQENLEEQTSRDLESAADAYLRLLLADMGTDAGRWAYFLEKVRLVPGIETRVLDRLEQVRPTIVDDRAELWAAVRHVRRWRARDDTESESGRWKRLYEDLTPNDPVLKYSWLFAPWPELPEREEDEEMDAEQAVLSSRRQQAIQEIGARQDCLQIWNAIAEQNTSTGSLGWFLGTSAFVQVLDAEILDKAPESGLSSQLPHYIKGRSAQAGMDWTLDKLRSMLAQGRQRDVEAALQALDTAPPTWDMVASLGGELEASYWQRVYHIYGDHSPSEWERAIDQLMRFNNLSGALQNATRFRGSLSAERAAMILGAVLSSEEALHRLVRDPSGMYQIDKLRERLEKEANADQTYGVLLATAELVTAAQAHGRARPTPHLSAAFVAEPGQFVGLVTQMYRRSGESSPERTAEEEEQATSRFQSAYRVLNAWKGYPGEGKPAAEREAILHDWCLTVLQRLAAEGRPDTGAIEVARVLARAPAGEDGLWPCLAARKLIESDTFPSLARGLHTAKRNLRGMTTRSLGEGGKQEREIASGFRGAAVKLRPSWPRTADMLEGLAEAYERDAEREDGVAATTLREEGAEPHDFGEPRQPPSPKRRAVRAGLIHLEKITLTDFALFERLEIKLEPPVDRGQWVFLLGENGKGKTTVLRALAMALGGENVSQAALAVLPSSPIREGRRAARCDVALAGQAYSVEITNDGTGSVAACEPPNGPRPLVFGYGCRRGSALGGNDSDETNSLFSDIATLFGESARLRPASRWLKDRKLLANRDERSAHVFDLVTSRLCQSLGTTTRGRATALLPDVERIEVAGDQIRVIAPRLGGNVPLGGLSDGYLTTLGWIVDLIANWLQWAERVGVSTEGNFFARMEGLVLLDELDLHLHPSWQRTIVAALREMFPRLSFVMTTHNPVTLLGAEPGEIFVLREAGDGGRCEAKQIDIPPGTRPDRILTGEWFGLPYVVDDETIELIERHQRMLLEGVSQDDPERRMVEDKLAARYGSYADTSLDRMALEEAAKLMQERRPQTPEQREALRLRLRERLRQRAAEREPRDGAKT
jgi:energy-coupling factor transporter ATP-binding protein EcfA2